MSKTTIKHTTLSQKPTVTVGIPAYNEERNIEKLILSIIQQYQSRYMLNSIIVLADGCTDNTVSIVKKLQKKYRSLHITNGGVRKGKAARLQQLFKNTTSDFIFLCDGDTVIPDKKTFDKMIRQAIKGDFTFLSSYASPIPKPKLTSKIISTQHELWEAVKKNVNPDHVLQSLAYCMLLKKSLYKKLKLPKGLFTDDHYIYFTNKELGGKYKPVTTTRVYFTIPDSLSEFSKQQKRYNTAIEEMNAYFSDVHDQYLIPLKTKLLSIVTFTFHHPFKGAIGISYLLVNRLISMFINIHTKELKKGLF